jgi:hypothetical protein
VASLLRGGKYVHGAEPVTVTHSAAAADAEPASLEPAGTERVAVGEQERVSSGEGSSVTSGDPGPAPVGSSPASVGGSPGSG